MLRSLTFLALTAGGFAIAPAAPVPVMEQLVIWSVPVKGMAGGTWAPDGRTVLTAGMIPTAAGRQGEVRVWDATTGRVSHTFRGTAASCGFLGHPPAVSPDGKTVAVCSGGDRPAPGAEWFVEVWDWGKGAPRLKLAGFDYIGTGVAFSPDGTTLAGVDLTGNLLVWNPATGKPVWDWQPRHKNRRKFNIPVFDPSGRVLAVSQGSEFAFFDARTGMPKGECEVKEGFVNADAWAFSPDGTRVAAATSSPSDKLRFAVFDVAIPDSGDVTVSNVRTAAAGVIEGFVGSVAFSPDGRYVVAAGGDGKVRVIDPGSCELTAVAHEHADAVSSVAFSWDGKLLLTVGRDAVKVLSVAELLRRRPE